MTTNPAAKREPLEPRLNEELIKTFPVDGKRLPPSRRERLMPGSYAKFQSQMREFQFSPEDICARSMPRSGTTLTAELAWLVANDLDLGKARDIPGTVKRVSAFLNKRYSDEDVAKFTPRVSIEEFQAKFVVNVPYPKEISAIKPRNYIRRGKIAV